MQLFDALANSFFKAVVHTVMFPLRDQAFHSTRKAKISNTEKEALASGSVGFEAELLGGRPDWGKLLDFAKPGLSAEEQARLAAVATAYHLLGLLPDTAGFARLILDLHAEELRGYFDPLTDSLFAVTGATPDQLREVLAHEMVHAAQAQYVDLGPAAQARRDNDERTAFGAEAYPGVFLRQAIDLWPGEGDAREGDDVLAAPQRSGD